MTLCAPVRKFPLSVDLAQGSLGGLADGAVFVLEREDQRADGTRVGNLAERGGGGLADVVVGVLERLPQELRGAVILDPAQRLDRKLPYIPELRR